MNLEFVNQSSTPMPKVFLKSWLKGIDRELTRRKIKRTKASGLTLVFLEAEPARNLNREFRKRDYATDVLSFQGDGKELLGELALCPEVIRKQAKEHGLSFRLELAYMVLHGFLHLLGYDHEASKSKARVMFALQDEIFADLKRLLKAK